MRTCNSLLGTEVQHSYFAKMWAGEYWRDADIEVETQLSLSWSDADFEVETRSSLSWRDVALLNARPAF